MTFSDLVGEVRSLRFDSSMDASIKQWINQAYATVWNADEWTFKYATSAVTVTTGSTQVSGLPADFGIALGLWRADGYPLRWMTPKDYDNLYYGALDTGAPTFFTIINGSIFVGPTSNETSASYNLLYEKRLTPLTADADEPAIPAQHHYLLVTGALSLGLALVNDFTYQFMEGKFQEGIQDMRKEWLNDQRGDVAQWGRDSLETLPSFWGI
jgi:hypothetical protein